MAKDYRTEDGAQIAPLSDSSDFQVAEGYRDIRGWRVDSADGAEIGKVHDLLVDLDGMRTRYLDVRLKSAVAASHGDRDVLIPIGSARIASETAKWVCSTQCRSRDASAAVRPRLADPCARIGNPAPLLAWRSRRWCRGNYSCHCNGRRSTSRAEVLRSRGADDRRFFDVHPRTEHEPIAAASERDIPDDRAGGFQWILRTP